MLQSSYQCGEKYQEGQGETERREERKEGGRGRGKGGELSVHSGSAISFCTHTLFDQLLKFLCSSCLAFN